MNILNRAKSIHSDYYPVGEWIEYEGRCFIIETDKNIGFEINSNSEPFQDGMLDGKLSIQDFIYEVHKDTRSINIDDMLDSQGNKIFASLDEYMLTGASILENSMFQGDYMIQHAVYSENCLCVADKDGEKYNIYENGHKLKVIGIQE